MHTALLHFAILIALLAGTGCQTRDPHDRVADAVTEEYVDRYVRPLSDPVARLAHKGLEIPPGLLQSNRVTLVEVRPLKGESRIIFKDDTRRPPEDGMITGVEHARKIGLYCPATLNQSEVEVRVNYFNDFGDDFVAVHIVSPNPLLVEKNRP